MRKVNDTFGVAKGAHCSNTPLCSVDLEHDVYLEAIAQLEAKVGRVISRAEFDSFVESSKSCTTLKQAKFELDKVERECHAKLDKTSFHRFFHRLNALFEPLRLIATALDTLSQANSTFCLIWGSLKVLILVCTQSSAPSLCFSAPFYRYCESIRFMTIA